MSHNVHELLHIFRKLHASVEGMLRKRNKLLEQIARRCAEIFNDSFTVLEKIVKQPHNK